MTQRKRRRASFGKASSSVRAARPNAEAQRNAELDGHAEWNAWLELDESEAEKAFKGRRLSDEVMTVANAALAAGHGQTARRNGVANCGEATFAGRGNDVRKRGIGDCGQTDYARTCLAMRTETGALR